jgi:methylenetetrahydrofolate reductase (NADPH)
LAAFREILMALLSFRKPGRKPGRHRPDIGHGGIPALLEDYSIEVMPRTAEKVEDFRALLPAGTRVYIAHIDGTEIDDMVATAKRLRDEGFEPMPHFPARSIPGPATLADWIRRYQARPA